MRRMLKILPVTPRVVCVHRADYLSCSYVVRTPEGIVLVDAGIDPTGDDMRAGIRALGGTVKEIRAVLLTHWHNDHVSGAPVLIGEGGAQAWYHADGAAHFLRARPVAPWRARLARHLPDQGPLSALQGLLEVGPPAPVRSAGPVRDGDEPVPGFRALETPGHEAGHLAWFFEPDGVLFCGDALAVSKGRVSFMSRYLTQDLRAARESMLRCLSLDVHAYCPGHRGPLVGVGAAQRNAAISRVHRARVWPIYGC